MYARSVQACNNWTIGYDKKKIRILVEYRKTKQAFVERHALIQ